MLTFTDVLLFLKNLYHKSKRDRFGKYRKAPRKKQNHLTIPTFKDNYHNYFSVYPSSLFVYKTVTMPHILFGK